MFVMRWLPAATSCEHVNQSLSVCPPHRLSISALCLITRGANVSAVRSASPSLYLRPASTAIAPPRTEEHSEVHGFCKKTAGV